MGALAYLCDDTRSDWSARPGQNVYTVPLSDKDQFLNHWDSDTRLHLADKTHAACLKRVRDIQAFHMGPDRGWADIGYNTLVCPHGRLIEGRGVLAVGAQCPGFNRSGIGSQFMVGGADVQPNVMFNRQRKFYDALRKARGETTRKMGHRDGVKTTCPGDKIYDWVKDEMPYLGSAGDTRPPVVIRPKPPAPDTAPGPHLPFPLSRQYYFGRDDGTTYSVSGYHPRTFKRRTARSWIQEFGSQMTRRGWGVGKGKTYLHTDGNNGYFGKEYETLVKAAQKAGGLRQDGKLGPKTWRWAFEAPVT